MPLCRAREIGALFQAEPDPAVAFYYSQFIIWAELRECLPTLVAWRERLQRHASDEVGPDDARIPRVQWMQFATACDAFGEHSATPLLLQEVRRNFQAGRLIGIGVSQLSDPAVLPFLESLLRSSVPPEGTYPLTWLSWQMILLTTEEGVPAAMSIPSDNYPTRDYWIEWLAKNQAKLQWIPEPSGKLSLARCFRVGWWRVQDR